MDQELVVAVWVNRSIGFPELKWAPRYIWLENAVLAKSQERALVDSTGEIDAEKKTGYRSVSEP